MRCHGSGQNTTATKGKNHVSFLELQNMSSLAFLCSKITVSFLILMEDYFKNP